jgi:hypothetical protein
VEVADRTEVGERAAPPRPTLDQFLQGLRTAWHAGEVRPTAVPKPKAKRGRRRPDPFAGVTAQLHEWFLAAPWLTSRDLLTRCRRRRRTPIRGRCCGRCSGA